MLPIAQTVPDTGEFRLVPFLVVRDGDAVAARRVELNVLDSLVTMPGDVTPPACAETFDRVVDAYDLDRMSRSRVVAVGVGGAASFIEDLARCGVGEFVLIDPDVVAESNIATQQVYRKDIGRPKVTALARRLRDVNPVVRIREISAGLDQLDDNEMRALCHDPIGGSAPAVTVLCGLTDNFFAQARINALALHLGVPSLCAQVWHQGRGAEITFTYPGLTPACHRCVLASRYRAYLTEGFVNDVTSHGTPIFATRRLNSIKGFLVLRPAASSCRCYRNRDAGSVLWSCSTDRQPQHASDPAGSRSLQCRSA